MTGFKALFRKHWPFVPAAVSLALGLVFWPRLPGTMVLAVRQELDVVAAWGLPKFVMILTLPAAGLAVYYSWRGVFSKPHPVSRSVRVVCAVLAWVFLAAQIVLIAFNLWYKRQMPFPT